MGRGREIESNASPFFLKVIGTRQQSTNTDTLKQTKKRSNKLKKIPNILFGTQKNVLDKTNQTSHYVMKMQQWGERTVRIGLTLLP